MHAGLIIVGGGAPARVVVEAARSDARGWRILGFVDPKDGSDSSKRLGVRYLGDDTMLQNHPTAAAILGCGSLPRSTARVTASKRLKAVLMHWATIAHAWAWVSPTTLIGGGTWVFVIGGHAI